MIRGKREQHLSLKGKKMKLILFWICYRCNGFRIVPFMEAEQNESHKPDVLPLQVSDAYHTYMSLSIATFFLLLCMYVLDPPSQMTAQSLSYFASF